MKSEANPRILNERMGEVRSTELSWRLHKNSQSSASPSLRNCSLQHDSKNQHKPRHYGALQMCLLLLLLTHRVTNKTTFP